MLQQLLDQLLKLNAELTDDEFVVVESEQGQDYPKTRTQQKNVIVDGENRLHFYSSVSPPLKVALFKAR
jgi:hypothetical protein